MLPINGFSMFDAGLYAENRTLTTSALSQVNTNGGLNYLTLGFPMKTDVWTMSFGLMPYSNVSYNVIASAPVFNRDEALASYQYEGSGGINQVYMSNGWQIVPGFLYLGARVGYAFGSITNETVINIDEQSFTIIGEDTLVDSLQNEALLVEGGTKDSEVCIVDVPATGRLHGDQSAVYVKLLSHQSCFHGHILV